MSKEEQRNKQIAITTIIAFFVILIAWTGAWLLWLALEARFEAFGSEWAELLYWLLIKTMIWILPGFWVLKRCDNAKRIFLVQSWKKTLVWGFAIGGFLLALNIGTRIMSGNWSLPYASPLDFLGVVIIAPISEEFIMRGAVLSALRLKLHFLTANIITAFLFMLLHFPGWYFKGVLQMNLLNPLSGALAILLIGFLLGVAAEKGKSLYSAIIVHMLNNLF